MTLDDLERSLDLWEERESRAYRNWRGYVEKNSTSPRRAFWYGRYRHARYMVARRQSQIRAKGPTRPRFLYSHHPPRGEHGPTGAVQRGSGHYTAGRVDKNDLDCQKLLDSYAAYHNGKWGDWLEYHVCISREGSIVWNRQPKHMGYGVGGHNTGTLHVVMHGTTGDTPTAAQQTSFRWLLDNWHTSKAPAKYRAPRDMSEVPWYGHNSFSGPGGQTACPGKFKTLYESKGRQR
jgi:hypothetical protein